MRTATASNRPDSLLSLIIQRSGVDRRLSAFAAFLLRVWLFWVLPGLPASPCVVYLLIQLSLLLRKDGQVEPSELAQLATAGRVWHPL